MSDAGTGTKWITNCGKDEMHTVIRDLERGGKGRGLIAGSPKATEQHSVSALERMGLVGIYETRPGTHHSAKAEGR